MLKSTLLKAATLSAACFAISGCAYGVGSGYYDDYGQNYGYSDPYCGGYDNYDYYYDCDTRAGFANIGFGGGYYNDYYYPGYGLFVFDRGGHRYQMDDRYRRYWARQRYGYYASRRGHRNGYGYGAGNRDQRNWTPEQRADRRERREDRRERRWDRRGDESYNEADDGRRGRYDRNENSVRQGRRGRRSDNGVNAGARGGRLAPSGVTTGQTLGNDVITQPRGRMTIPRPGQAPRTARRAAPESAAPQRSRQARPAVTQPAPAPAPAARPARRSAPRIMEAPSSRNHENVTRPQ